MTEEIETIEEVDVNIPAPSQMKVYVVGTAVRYADWLADIVEIVNKMEDADLVLFTGGEDVYPPLYGEKTGSHTYYYNVWNGLKMPARDYVEKCAFEDAVALGKPMFGVCRGIQFLTAMNGGTLVQHVTDHAGEDHNILWMDGEVTDTTSLHHQMCNPYNLPSDSYEVLAVSQISQSKMYLNGDDAEIKMPAEPEVIYYPKTKCLGVQGHPEMYRYYNTPLHNKLRSLIKEKLLS